VHAKSPGRDLSGIVGATFSDPTNERLIYLSAIALVLIGVALLVGTILWWRRGRPEHPALAPLEVMSSRSWEKAPETERRRRLDSVRMNGVVPEQAPIVRADPIDLEALVRSTPQAFDDLRESWDLAPQAAAEPPHVYEVNASGEVEQVAEAEEATVEPVADPAAEPVAQSDDEPVAESVDDRVAEPLDATLVESHPEADVDATTFAERPDESVEELSPVPTEPSR